MQQNLQAMRERMRAEFGVMYPDSCRGTGSMRKTIQMLLGLATGNRLHLRVGSSMNHAAELDLDEGTLDYYDTDENVVEGLMSVLDFVLNCEKTPYGMRCENVKKD